MALIANALTTIEHAKLSAGVFVATYDAWFELYINRISTKILNILGRKLKFGEYSEVLSGTGRQLLILAEWPISSVTEVTLDGAVLTVDVDYRLDDQDKAMGALYRGEGWSTSVYTQGLAGDVVAATRGIEVTYEAGYYFPGDEDYEEGAADSLPLDLQGLVDEVIAAEFLRMKTETQGLKSYSEGGLSMSWTDAASSGEGFTEGQLAVLAKYERGPALA